MCIRDSKDIELKENHETEQNLHNRTVPVRFPFRESAENRGTSGCSRIPVATVGINGALNAGILAVQMLAVGDEQLQEKLSAYKE